MFGVTDKDIQFGRQASVIFDNYSTGESILINDYSNIFDENGKRLPMLRVGFEFTKSLDENTNWSTGNVKIYGLTLETFNKLGDYLETEVEVQVGYEYSTTRKLNKLFRAVLIDKSYVIESGISVATFSLQGYYYAANSTLVEGKSKKLSLVFSENQSVLAAIGELVDNTGFDGFDFDLIPIRTAYPTEADRIANYIESWKFHYGKSYSGTPKEILGRICEEYGLGFVVDSRNVVLLFFTELGAERHMNNLIGGEVLNPNVVSSTPTNGKEFNFKNDTASILLNGDTGLLGLPTVKTKTVTKQYSAAVEASEKVFSQKPVIGKVNKKGEAIIDKETGKQKLKVPKTKKVLRRSVEAVCLINTAIEPQVYVTLSIRDDNELSGDYRVRTVGIDGDTESGNWNMTLSLEGEW